MKRLAVLPVLLVCALLGVFAIPATVGAVTVSDEAELRAAFADAAETQIDLAASVTLTDCTGTLALSRNSATDLVLEGHGFTITQTCVAGVMEAAGTGALTLRDVVITGGQSSSANGGGGVSAAGELTVERSIVTGNSAVNGGGGISGDIMSITDSTISDNQGGESGGGGVSARLVSIVGSTISGNEAQAGGGVAAGGIQLVNSTVTANTATELGGGLFVGQGEMELVYGTIVGNTATTGANVNMFSGAGSVRSFGTVIARPTGSVNCVVSNVTSHYSFSDDTSCAFVDPTDRQGAGNPMLDALAANGGPTPTMLPAVGSPLIDGIPVSDCRIDDASEVTTDQRGLPRPAGDGCDIGAVELQPIPLTPLQPPIAQPVPLQPRFTG